MRRTLLALVVLLAGLPIAPAQAGPAWRGRPTLISGTSRLDSGEWIYTDFVYDDYGADTGSWGQPNVVSLAGTNGDARYPAGKAFKDNAADIVEVRAQVVGNDLNVRVLLQTITKASTPAIWVQGDGFAGVFTEKNADVNAAANTVAFTLPNVATDRTLKLNIGAGLNNGNGKLRAGVPGNSRMFPDELTTGGPTDNRLMDLAFNTRRIEPRGGAWNEVEQSAALFSGDLGRFAQTLDIAAMRRGATTPIPSPTGYSVRLFRSRQNLGEGMAAEFPQYRGKWQPYAVWVPKDYNENGSNPFFLSMHSLSVHHNQYRGGTNATYATYYEQFGNGLDAVVATPLARGPDGWYQDEGLIDTLEVWNDVLRNFRIDRDRVWVGGYSMGGYGTYRFTTLMPDAFASAVSIVGPPGNGIWAYPGPPPGGEDSPDFTYPQLENTLHVPFWITHGVLDELVPVAGVREQAARFGELGHEYRFALHPAADHLSFTVHDEWSREVNWFRKHPVRIENPAEITLKVRPRSWSTKKNDNVILGHLRALTKKVGADINGAYWVDDVKTAGKGDVTGFVDLVSHGISRRRGGETAISEPRANGPTPHMLTGLEVGIKKKGTGDTLTGRLKNVRSLTIDVGRAGLSNSPKLDIKFDRHTRITFVRSGRVVGRTHLGVVTLSSR